MEGKTLNDLALETLQVQDACNLSGVVHSFARVISRLRELLPHAGTDEINTHPICMLWSDKIASLTGTQGARFVELSDAYRTVYTLVESVRPVSTQVAQEAMKG